MERCRFRRMAPCWPSMGCCGTWRPENRLPTLRRRSRVGSLRYRFHRMEHCSPLEQEPQPAEQGTLLYGMKGKRLNYGTWPAENGLLPLRGMEVMSLRCRFHRMVEYWPLDQAMFGYGTWQPDNGLPPLRRLGVGPLRCRFHRMVEYWPAEQGQGARLYGTWPAENGLLPLRGMEVVSLRCRFHRMVEYWPLDHGITRLGCGICLSWPARKYQKV